jgi:succinate dehydrogenase/fumarate reductase-like Fe-S protein
MGNILEICLLVHLCSLLLKTFTRACRAMICGSLATNIFKNMTCWMLLEKVEVFAIFVSYTLD